MQLTSISKESRIRLLALAFILLNLADVALTLAALQSGTRDLNPFLQGLFGPGLAGTVLFKIGGSAFFAWVMCLYKQMRVLKIAVAAMTVICLLNLMGLQLSSVF